MKSSKVRVRMTLAEKNRTYPLLTVSDDAKTKKGEKEGFLTGILYLAPHKAAGVGNFCSNASPGCIKTCLFTAGRARIHPTVNKGRIRKTLFFVEDRKGFMIRLYRDIVNLIRKAEKMNMVPCVRLDGTSDIQLSLRVAEDFPNVQFYDYTKNVGIMEAFMDGELPRNVHFTFSRSEKNQSATEAFLAKGAGVAMIFEQIPEIYKGYKVIHADQSDLRFMDRELFDLRSNEGYVAALTPKGEAKNDTTGFVIPLRSDPESADK